MSCSRRDGMLVINHHCARLSSSYASLCDYVWVVLAIRACWIGHMKWAHGCALDLCSSLKPGPAYCTNVYFIPLYAVIVRDMGYYHPWPVCVCVFVSVCMHVCDCVYDYACVCVCDSVYVTVHVSDFVWGGGGGGGLCVCDSVCVTLCVCDKPTVCCECDGSGYGSQSSSQSSLAYGGGGVLQCVLHAR